MIDDAMFVYLLFQLLLFVFALIGYSKLPVLSLLVVLGVILTAVPTINSFGEDYWMLAIILLIINGTIPVIGLSRTVKGD